MAKGKTDLPGADLLFGSHTKSRTPVRSESLEPVVKEEPTIERKGAEVVSLEPVKFTFYFNPQILEDLEVAKFRLRMERRIKVSKSDIVNAALAHCMKDIVFLEKLVKGELN